MGLVAGIIGAAGYAGAELVRILSRHPEFDLRVITSSTDEGLPIWNSILRLRVCAILNSRRTTPPLLPIVMWSSWQRRTRQP